MDIDQHRGGSLIFFEAEVNGECMVGPIQSSKDSNYITHTEERIGIELSTVSQ